MATTAHPIFTILNRGPIDGGYQHAKVDTPGGARWAVIRTLEDDIIALHGTRRAADAHIDNLNTGQDTPPAPKTSRLGSLKKASSVELREYLDNTKAEEMKHWKVRADVMAELARR